MQSVEMQQFNAGQRLREMARNVWGYGSAVGVLVWVSVSYFVHALGVFELATLLLVPLLFSLLIRIVAWMLDLSDARR